MNPLFMLLALLLASFFTGCRCDCPDSWRHHGDDHRDHHHHDWDHRERR